MLVFYVAVLMYLFVLCVSCLVKQFAICLGVVAILLLNVMEVFSVSGGALLDRPCMVWFSKECGCCACDHSVYLSVPSIGNVCFYISEVISSFKSLRDGSQVFSLLMLFLDVNLHTMWLGKSLQFMCIIPFGMLCLSTISMMFVKIMLQCVCWWIWWSERKRTLCLP